jgi:putative endonuclease
MIFPEWCYRLFRRGPADTGRWGERIAARYLQQRGYAIIEQRIRLRRHGDLDLVARDGNALVFVEVKTRSKTSRVRPRYAVSRRQQRSLQRSAMHYLSRLSVPPPTFRFDIIEIIGHPDQSNDPEIHHIRNAFTLRNRRHAQW